MGKRISYAFLTLLLICVEVLIALFVHDKFIRPYVGDVLVVIVLYCLIRVFIPTKVKFLWLYVFIFAAGVELLQLVHIVDLLGLGNIPFFRVLIGSVCDIKDILCYAVGCALTAVCDFLGRRHKKKHDLRGV